MGNCCIWKYQMGGNNSHWAFALCDKSYKYLSKLPDGEPFIGVADCYNGTICPSCGKPVKMDYRLIGAENDPLFNQELYDRLVREGIIEVYVQVPSKDNPYDYELVRRALNG